MRIVRCIFESLHEYLSGQPISASQRLKILMTCFQPPGSMKQRHENQAFRFTQLGSFCSEPKKNLPILNPGWPLHPAPVTNLCGPSPASPIALLYPRNWCKRHRTQRWDASLFCAGPFPNTKTSLFSTLSGKVYIVSTKMLERLLLDVNTSLPSFFTSNFTINASRQKPSLGGRMSSLKQLKSFLPLRASSQRTSSHKHVKLQSLANVATTPWSFTQLKDGLAKSFGSYPSNWSQCWCRANPTGHPQHCCQLPLIDPLKRFESTKCPNKIGWMLTTPTNTISTKGEMFESENTTWRISDCIPCHQRMQLFDQHTNEQFRPANPCSALPMLHETMQIWKKHAQNPQNLRWNFAAEWRCSVFWHELHSIDLYKNWTTKSTLGKRQGKIQNVEGAYKTQIASKQLCTSINCSLQQSWLKTDWKYTCRILLRTKMQMTI